MCEAPQSLLMLTERGEESADTVHANDFRDNRAYFKIIFLMFILGHYVYADRPVPEVEEQFPSRRMSAKKLKKKDKEEKKIKEVAKKEKEIELLEKRLREAEAISATKVSQK